MKKKTLPIKTVRYRIVRSQALAPATTGKQLAPREYPSFPKRDYKKIIGLAFLGVLLALIFFSKTIYGYNLPVITAVKPENGRLSKLETSSGIASFAETENIYAALGGKVEEVMVKEGDTVQAGQELYRLSFDKEDAGRKLRELQNNRGKLQTDIQAINLKLEKLERYMEDLSDETYEADYVSSYELDALAIDIRKARTELEEIRDRYDEGEATDLEVDKARYALQSLYLKQEELERKLVEQQQQAEKTVEEQEKSRESKTKDYEVDIAALQLDLQAKQIELSNLSIQEEPYRAALSDMESNAVITAPADGTVLSIPVQKGEAIREDQLIAAIGQSGTFTIECMISLENNFVLPGDTVKLSNSTHVLEGVVSTISPEAQGKKVSIAVSSDKATSGETFEIAFEKTSDTTYTLVPNGALGQDSDGYFLNLVKKRSGIMGDEYYLERLDVFVGDSDTKNTAITHGITFFEPVALISDKPITAGDVVSLSNVSDFFEK